MFTSIRRSIRNALSKLPLFRRIAALEKQVIRLSILLEEQTTRLNTVSRKAFEEHPWVDPETRRVRHLRRMDMVERSARRFLEGER
jgi:hypothetical protein